MAATSRDRFDREQLALIVGLLIGFGLLHSTVGPEILTVLSLVGLAAVVYALYLFYRLVVAVERIADKL
ncbi:hypothetical protein [Natronorubrum texcoconense]|uniref:Uncharacterized protein n=1 Tax=Natronorubrum texcoconense TaxID=1095776 RepID=A0A1G9E4F7_9EURY|nr:hypothetical protein [Natronorubrum texcoconense]SDK70988.1 hypothetical protein SAMN04515672_3754 [Natronorubrum texcoconense]